jgi:hypothetical protein
MIRSMGISTSMMTRVIHPSVLPVQALLNPLVQVPIYLEGLLQLVQPNLLALPRGPVNPPALLVLLHRVLLPALPRVPLPALPRVPLPALPNHLVQRLRVPHLRVRLHLVHLPRVRLHLVHLPRVRLHLPRVRRRVLQPCHQLKVYPQPVSNRVVPRNPLQQKRIYQRNRVTLPQVHSARILTSPVNLIRLNQQNGRVVP